jgi:CRP-like cAMP-binding protein
MYLFDEVFQMFRGFFLQKEFEHSQFFYDVAFYLLPRKAEAGEKILEQGDDVNEIYFILDGEVKLSYQTDVGEIARYFGKDYYFGDYYVFFEKPAEFDYTSTTPVNMLVLPKSKMLELASKYKNIYDKMLSNSIRNSMYTSKAMVKVDDQAIFVRLQSREGAKPCGRDHQAKPRTTDGEIQHVCQDPCEGQARREDQGQEPRNLRRHSSPRTRTLASRLRRPTRL